jgi:membrane protease YdiL (CAAX protease family)
MILENRKIDEVTPCDDEISKTRLNIGVLLGFGYLFIFPAVILILLLGIFFFGQEVSEAQYNTYGTIAQMIAAVLVIIGMCFLVGSKLKVILKDCIKDSSIGYSLIFLVLIFFVCNIYSAFIEKFVDNETTANQESIYEIFETMPVIAFLFVSIIAPIVEELIFRYFIYNRLKNMIGAIVSIFVTTLIFAAIHLVASLQSGTIINDLKLFPLYLLPSFILTFAYFKTKKVAVPILIHIAFNTIQAIFILIEPLLITSSSSSSPLSTIIISLLEYM